MFCIRYVGVEDSKLEFELSVGMLRRRRPPAPPTNKTPLYRSPLSQPLRHGNADVP